MKNKIYINLLKLALRVHNFSYKFSTKLAVKMEDGLHPKHRLMNYHQFFVENINEGDVVLDMGCGNGALTYDVAKKAKKVTGVDFDEKNIRIGKERYQTPNIEYIVGDITSFDSDEKFNVIILSNVLEHIENRIGFLKKIRKLAPKTLARVPMINRDWITLYKKELGISYKLDNTHFIEYTLEKFRDEIEKAGFKIKSYSIQFGEIWAVLY